MNLLIDKLPTSIKIGDRDVKIKTDRRTWLAFELVLTNSFLSNLDKMRNIINILDEDIKITNNNIENIINELIIFYNCGAKTNDKDNKKVNSTKKVYSLEHDQYRIYSDFKQFYNIDLENEEYIHWWKYRQLFLELPKEAKTKEVMMYRSITIDSKMSKEQKEHYLRMKSLYSIKDKEESVDTKANRIANVFANGMKTK